MLTTTWTPPIDYKPSKIILEGNLYATKVKIEIDDSTPTPHIEDCCRFLQSGLKYEFDREKRICNRIATCYYILRRNDKRSKEELEKLTGVDNKNWICDME